MRKVGIARCVVNSTQSTDWPKVAELANQHPNLVIPAFGLHPWYINQAPGDWLDQLERWLTRFPRAGIGECGLDRWIEGHDIELQSEVFAAQLNLASQHKRPLSIHCVRAWGRLVELLESHPLPPCGFLLHSYGGSADLIPRLARLGAYFSFSGSLLHPKNSKRRQVFSQIPPDRILIESDAPDMLPPADVIGHPLPDHINHPANLPKIATAVAKTFDISNCDANFNTLFTPSEDQTA